jgi:hypothetical protein
MRLLNYLFEEWNVQTGYAGRGIVKSTSDPNVIVWMFLQVPLELGLLWTLPDGSTFLNTKNMGKVDVKNTSSTTHKQILAQLYNELGYAKLDGDLRENVEEWHEKNVRGRIIKNEIYSYDFEGADFLISRRWDGRTKQGIALVKRFIESDWYKKG